MDNLTTSSLQQLLLYVFFLLASISIACVLIRHSPAKINISDFSSRLSSWWVVFIYLAILTLSPVAVATLMFALLLFQSLKECLRALRLTNRSVILALQLTISIQALFLIAMPSFYICVFFTIAISFGLLLFFRYNISRKFSRFSAHIIYSLLITAAISIATLAVATQDEDKLMWFCCSVLLTQLNDVYQYISGKVIGKHPVTPRLSPNKTIEGIVGGVLLTAMTSVLLCGYFLNVSVAPAAAFGLLISLFGFFGDIIFSALKRSCRIKDFGNIFPGFGGLLDRIDSSTLTLPVSTVFYLLYTG